MTVKDVGIETDERQNFHNTAAEKGKAFAVVIVSVTTGSFKVIFVIHEIEFNVIYLIFEDSAILVSPGERHENVADKFEILTVFFFNILIERNDDPHVESVVFCDRFGKRTDHFRKPSRCNKRRGFRCDKEYLFLFLHNDFGGCFFFYDCFRGQYGYGFFGNRNGRIILNCIFLCCRNVLCFGRFVFS